MAEVREFKVGGASWPFGRQPEVVVRHDGELVWTSVRLVYRGMSLDPTVRRPPLDINIVERDARAAAELSDEWVCTHHMLEESRRKDGFIEPRAEVTFVQVKKVRAMSLGEPLTFEHVVTAEELNALLERIDKLEARPADYYRRFRWADAAELAPRKEERCGL